MVKKLEKIFIILLLIMITLPTNLIQVLAIEIGDSPYLERGNLGFYTVQFDDNGVWTYISYDIVRYIDKDGTRRVAYCLDRDLSGVGWVPGDVEGSTVDITELLQDVRLWRVYINGYPYCTPAQLGVETEEDAYLATKHAAYWVIQGKSLSNVRSYYRAGQTEINGQNLYDIQRRGQKVVDAIYNLVNKAYNTNTTPETADIIEINKIGDFVQDSNSNYYSQKYSVTSKTTISQYTIKNCVGFPTGTYIANLNGESKTTFNAGEQFKIMIPKNTIKNNILGAISVQGKCLTYPVYYGASRIAGRQNYAIIADPYGDYSAAISLNVNAYKSSIKIVKTDEETGKKLSGVTFNARYEDNTNIGDFTTNSEGIINITGLRQSKIILTEKKTQNEYIINANEEQVTIGYNESKTIDVTNKHKKGNLKIYKVDLDNNKIPIPNVEFEVTDQDGYKYTTKTDKNGIAYISNIRTGIASIKETKTSSVYKLDGKTYTAEIKWNETAELTIQNEKKKGQIKVIKVDKDNNAVKLEGVKFDVLDENKNVVDTIVTDKNGVATTKKLAIDQKYTVVEKVTKNEYVLTKETQTVTLKENEITTITFQNEKKKGQIKVIKVDKDNNAVKLEGVKFDVLDENKNVVDTIVTDKNGVATTKKLAIDQKYTVVEKVTKNEYILTTETQTVTLKQDEITTITFKNEHKKGNLKIYKVDLDNNKLPVSDVEFEVTDQEGYKYTAKTDKNGIAYIPNIRTGIASIKETKTNSVYKLDGKTYTAEIKWNETAEITIKNEKLKGQIKVVKIDKDKNELKLEGVKFDVLDESKNVVDTIVTDKNGVATTKRLPIDQKYTVVEKVTKNEYILTTETQTVTLKQDEITTITFQNERKKGNLKIYKVDLDNNKLPVPDVEFEITDQEGYKYTAKTDKDGIAYIPNIRTGMASIKELKTNKIYKLNTDLFKAEIEWNKTEVLTIKNEKLKGQIEVYKVDEENKKYKLEGVEFEIINSNNEVVEKITTNKNGYAITSRHAIGEYRIKEVKTDSMHILNNEIIKVNVSTDIISKLEITNKRIKGQIKIIKTSEDDNFINETKSGTPIKDVEFKVYDSNKKLVDTIITNEEGIAITRKLDKGKYFIKESKSGKWYLLNENEFTAIIEKHGEIVELNIENESEKPDVEIEKTGIIQTTANEEIRYDFKIENTGNVPLDNFTWYDFIPTDYIRATRLVTGTYNQELEYAIYYKTNKNDYKLLKDGLNTQVNNYIDLMNLEFEDDEYITEFKVKFGTVDVEFKSVITPYLYTKVESTVKDDDTFTNETRVEGYNEEYLVWDEDDHTTKVYKKKIEITLPRTGC